MDRATCERRSRIADAVHLGCVAPEPGNVWVIATQRLRHGATPDPVVHVNHCGCGLGTTLSPAEARVAAAELRGEWTGDRARHLQLALLARRLVTMAAEAERLVERA